MAKIMKKIWGSKGHGEDHMIDALGQCDPEKHSWTCH